MVLLVWNSRLAVLFCICPCGRDVEGFNQEFVYKCHDYICVLGIPCGQYYEELFGLGKV